MDPKHLYHQYRRHGFDESQARDAVLAKGLEKGIKFKRDFRLDEPSNAELTSSPGCFNILINTYQHTSGRHFRTRYHAYVRYHYVPASDYLSNTIYEKRKIGCAAELDNRDQFVTGVIKLSEIWPECRVHCNLGDAHQEVINELKNILGERFYRMCDKNK